MYTSIIDDICKIPCCFRTCNGTCKFFYIFLWYWACSNILGIEQICAHTVYSCFGCVECNYACSLSILSLCFRTCNGPADLFCSWMLDCLLALDCRTRVASIKATAKRLPLLYGVEWPHWWELLCTIQAISLSLSHVFMRGLVRCPEMNRRVGNPLNIQWCIE